jgi:predicted dehydrogenase
MSRKLRVGVLGCGLMGGIHAACYAREKNCEIIGFHNRTREKAQQLAMRFGGDVFDSAEALLQAPQLDAVSIATSQQVHAEQILLAARAGKHILCEKPVGLTITELDEIEEALRKSDVTFMTAHQLRFHPIIEWAKKKQSRLGRVYHLDLEMSFRIKGHQGRCFEDYRSGGFFMELGCHLTDLSRHLMGEVRHVSGHTLRLDPQRVTEDCAQSLVQFESGAIGSIIVSANHRTKRQGLLLGRILGEKGRIDFTIYPYARNFNTATLTLDKGQSVFVPDTTTEKFPTASLPSSLFPDYRGFFDIYQREVHTFLQSVRRSTPPLITFADGRAAVELVLATYAAQGVATEHPNHGTLPYRADEACHALLRSEA